MARDASEYGLVNDVEELNNSAHDLGANSQGEIDENEGSILLFGKDNVDKKAGGAAAGAMAGDDQTT